VERDSPSASKRFVRLWRIPDRFRALDQLKNGALTEKRRNAGTERVVTQFAVFG
jgi:hypothetical protein